jgi:glycosyltransferase involved in cell wall biosynthesis
MMTSIIIPAHNEAVYISALLKNIPKKYEVIVVDDGSTDGTEKIVKEMGCKTSVLSENKGKGFACLEGLKKAKSDSCIFIDGDGQLNPKDIPKIEKLLRGNDLVIGIRSAKQIPWQRRVSNKFAKKCVNYICGTNFDDALCGFRGVHKNKFLRLRLKKLGYFFESEMILEATKNGWKISQTNVDVSYNTGSRMPMSKSIPVALWLFKNVLKKALGMYK